MSQKTIIELSKIRKDQSRDNQQEASGWDTQSHIRVQNQDLIENKRSSHSPLSTTVLHHKLTDRLLSRSHYNQHGNHIPPKA